MKTWKVEGLVVGGVLFGTLAVTHRLVPREMVGTLAVLLSFGHTQISDRLAEAEGARTVPQVECYRKLLVYFTGKEMCWAAYFWWAHAYSALVGVGVFLLYPFWRRLYRRRHPKTGS